MTFLLHDEIAEILRSAPVGSVVDIRDLRTVKVSAPVIDYDGIRASDKCYLDTRSGPDSLWFVPPEVLTSEIYDAIESGHTVTVDNQNILEI